MMRGWKIALGMFGALAAVEAGAEPLDSRQVSYADLDLDRARDIDRFRSRVRRAARSLCFDATRDSIAVETLDRACFTEAVERADRQIAQAVQAHRSNVKMASGKRFVLVQPR